MTTKKQKVLTLEEAEKKEYSIYEFPNGDYFYIDKKRVKHLIKKNKEVAKW